MATKRAKARYHPRKCPHCKAVFTPLVRGGLEQRFCCPQHRKAFHQYGSLPFEKLMERIRKEIREIVRTEVALMIAPIEEWIARVETFFTK